MNPKLNGKMQPGNLKSLVLREVCDYFIFDFYRKA